MLKPIMHIAELVTVSLFGLAVLVKLAYITIKSSRILAGRDEPLEGDLPRY